MEMADSTRAGFFRRRIARPILDSLRQGVTPEKLALSIALGAALGVFPLPGTTTALCALAALLFRLNLPAIQIVNYSVYPAQLALLLPFFRLGKWLFRAPHLPLSATQLIAMMRASYWGSLHTLWITAWHGVVAWCLLGLAFVPLGYVILLHLLRRMLRAQE